MSTAILDQFIDQLAEAVADKLKDNMNIQDGQIQEDPPSFMNKGQVADYLNISRATIDRWIKTRKFPSTKVGGKYLYKREEVDRWVKENSK
ncbi:helix-turn-helix domain-containing protein [Limosilactobacillus reuteri]|uniref:helix-turn-helix domain-containing protein n=1 Tax=Limosilactobacillus reuteri TaxID=1598 RepID=UPI001E3AB847|nr:helix-turn-helix domain-containing protein [Limosilactobacillus reuteri]MCC4440447.1 helix-turn-helix domain-containing protein [Limosilactobacillus reuteri]